MIIISRTPFRISFVGGGTDLRSFYNEEPGKVLSTSINKYIYVVVKRQLGIVEHKYRVNWSQVEFKNRIEDIEHPIVREALKLMEIDFPVEITTFADIPPGTGLGSSSSFCVGLINALNALKGESASKHDLAKLAAKVEIDILNRAMGKQDHYAAAYGGLNVFTFKSDESVIIDPVTHLDTIGNELENNLLIFYTALKRNASDILKVQVQETSNKRDSLRKMRDLVLPLRDVVSSGKKLSEFGQILHENWILKQNLTNVTSNKEIDQYYLRAIKAGAIGGKLLGAGGGGFLLFYVEPDKQESVINELKDLFYLKISFDKDGSQITYMEES